MLSKKKTPAFSIKIHWFAIEGMAYADNKE